MENTNNFLVSQQNTLPDSEPILNSTGTTTEPVSGLPVTSPDLFTPTQSATPPVGARPNLFSNFPQHPAPAFPRSNSPSSAIDINVSPTTSDPDDDADADDIPHTRSHRPSPPRAGPHSTLAAQTRRTTSTHSGPAGNRSGHAASDIWMFVDKQKRVCMLCE